MAANRISMQADAETAQKQLKIALLDDDEVAVVRVHGRGSFLNSVPLKRFAEHLGERGKPTAFLVDLEHCETMDSTFMGVLASISLAQKRAGRARVEIINAGEHIQRLLKTLGLVHILTLRGPDVTGRVERAEESLKDAGNDPVSHAEQIAHCLEAHKTLVNLDDENEVRFQNVIQYFENALQARKSPADGSGNANGN